MAYDLVQGDTATTLYYTCKDATGSLIDLTNCTVHLFWEFETGGKAHSAKMTIDDAVAGEVSYQFVSGDLDGYDTMTAEVRITDSSDDIVTSSEYITYEVRKRLKPYLQEAA